MNSNLHNGDMSIGYGSMSSQVTWIMWIGVLKMVMSVVIIGIWIVTLYLEQIITIYLNIFRTNLLTKIQKKSVGRHISKSEFSTTSSTHY